MNAGHADGLLLPPVELGYAPLNLVRQGLIQPDRTVILAVKAIVTGATLLPPALGAIGVAILLFWGG